MSPVSDSAGSRIADQTIEQMEDEGKRAGGPRGTVSAVDDSGTLEALRSLIVGPDRSSLQELRDRQAAIEQEFGALKDDTRGLVGDLQDPGRRGQFVGEVLAEAIDAQTRMDHQRLSRALTPSVQDAIGRSVSENPAYLAGALFPVMMPAVRRAISSALEHLVERVSRTIDQRFSLQSLRWRFQAARAGVPYAEYLLAKTIEFRVEQVFLIHKPSGLLLLHAASDPKESKDPDLVSGMLTAIQDFVYESFGSADNEALDLMEVGSLKVWIEQASHCVLAAVVRGIPPQDLRDQLEETSKAVLVRHYSALTEFDGDTAPFEASLPLLERLLRAQYRDLRSERRPAAVAFGRVLRWTVVVALLALIGTGAYLHIRDSIRWNRYLERLRTEPGLVVTDHARMRVEGLRDPVASDPMQLMERFDLDSTKVRATWRPFRSSEPALEAVRATSVLDPPPGVVVSFSEGTLRLSGEAPAGWISRADILMKTFPTLSFDVSRLLAEIPEALRAVAQRIDNTQLRFREGQTVLTRAQEAAVAQLLNDAESLGASVMAVGFLAHVEVIGHASAEGSEELNLRLSLARAETIASLLRDRTVDTTVVRISARGAGTSDPIDTGDPAADRFASRRVTFHSSIIRR